MRTLSDLSPVPATLLRSSLLAAAARSRSKAKSLALSTVRLVRVGEGEVGWG